MGLLRSKCRPVNGHRSWLRENEAETVHTNVPRRWTNVKPTDAWRASHVDILHTPATSSSPDDVQRTDLRRCAVNTAAALWERQDSGKLRLWWILVRRREKAPGRQRGQCALAHGFVPWYRAPAGCGKRQRLATLVCGGIFVVLSPVAVFRTRVARPRTCPPVADPPFRGPS